MSSSTCSMATSRAGGRDRGKKFFPSDSVENSLKETADREATVSEVTSNNLQMESTRSREAAYSGVNARYRDDD